MNISYSQQPENFLFSPLILNRRAGFRRQVIALGADRHLDVGLSGTTGTIREKTVG